MATRHLLSTTGRALVVVLAGLLGCARPDTAPTQQQPVGLRASLEGHSKVRMVAFSSDGQTLAVGSDTDVVRVWDLGAGKELFRLSNTAGVNALVFSPDGRMIATAGDEPVIRFWDAKSGQEKDPYRVKVGKVKLLAFSPDGATLASWCEGEDRFERIHFWDVATGTEKEPLHLFRNELPLEIRFAPGGQTLAVSRCGPDGIDFWNLTTHKKRFVLIGSDDPIPGDGYVSKVHYCSGGRKMAFYQQETVVHLWDLDQESKVASFEITNRSKFPTAALRGDGKLAAVGEGNGILTLWNPETGKKVAVVQASQRHIPYAYFSPDGRTMATHEVFESAVKIWDVPTLVGKEKL